VNACPLCLLDETCLITYSTSMTSGGPECHLIELYATGNMNTVSETASRRPRGSTANAAASQWRTSAACPWDLSLFAVCLMPQVSWL